MVAFIDAHRETHGVEPICDVLAIAPSTYYEAKAKQANPSRRSTRAHARRSAGAPLPKRWMNCYGPHKSNLLRRPVEPGQYLAIRYSERLAAAGIEASVGSRGDSYDCEYPTPSLVSRKLGVVQPRNLALAAV